jgi:uncharacterized protein YkwD
MKTRHIAIIALSALLPCFAAPAAEAADSSSQSATFTPVADAASRTLELINRERASAGLVALTLDDEVSPIAADWSRKMAADGGLSHNGEYLSQASMQRLGASRLGENVAFADSVDEIHSLFMNSAPHRANILQTDFRQIGIAAVRAADGSIYLTEDFLTRGNGGPEGGAQPSPAEKSAKRPKGKSGSARKAPAKRAQRAQARPNRNRTRARRR